MNIIILTQYYLPEIGAPQRRLSELAEQMTQAGHTVTVLTAMPSYPLGKIHKGYGGLFKSEEINGVKIIRSFIYPTQKISILYRLLNYFSFVLSSLITGIFALPKADFLIVESPPLFLGLSAICLTKLKHSRLIFNVSDLWPESAVRLNIVREGSLAHRLSLSLELICYNLAWLVTCQSKGIMAEIQRRFPKTKTFLLSNGANVDKFSVQKMNLTMRNYLVDKANLDDKESAIIVLYAGLHGLAQGLSQVIEVAGKMIENDHLLFILVGDGPEKSELVENAKRFGLRNILFLDPILSENVPAMLASADILLVVLKDYIPGAVPSKLYESMATGKPVIMVAAGEPADIVREYKTGVVIEPGNIDGFVAAVLDLANRADLRTQLGQNGRKTVEEYFNRDKIINHFISYLEGEI